MPNVKTDSKGFSTNNADLERDNASKGPVSGVGNPDGEHGISSPYYEDLQTQIAAKGKQKKNNPTPQPAQQDDQAH